jgi:hypothetical protein
MCAEEGQAERSGQAERRGIGVSGVSLDYGYPPRTHAEEFPPSRRAYKRKIAGVSQA